MRKRRRQLVHQYLIFHKGWQGNFMSENRLVTYCLVILTIVALSAALIYTKPILIPFLLALSISYLAAPAIDVIEKNARLPRSSALIVVAMGSVLVLSALGVAIISGVREMATQAGAYQLRLLSWMEHLFNLGNQWGLATKGLTKENMIHAINQLPFLSYAQEAASFLVKALGNTGLVILFVLFLLAGRSFSLPQTQLWQEVDKRIRRFLVVKFILAFSGALIAGIVYFAFGLDLAPLLTILTFVLAFIPNIGPIIATVLPIPVAMLQLEHPAAMAIVVGVPAISQFIIGNVLEPKYLGDSLDLHPVTQMLALMFWGLLWGVPGMLLATPITVILKIFLDNTRQGKMWAELMAGRLSPRHTIEPGP